MALAGIPVRRNRSRTTVAASSVTGTSRNTPPNRPTGVRIGSQITASRINPVLRVLLRRLRSSVRMVARAQPVADLTGGLDDRRQVVAVDLVDAVGTGRHRHAEGRDHPTHTVPDRRGERAHPLLHLLVDQRPALLTHL